MPVDAARLDQRVLGLAAIGAAVHAQRAADRAGNAAKEREPGDAGLLRRARDLHVGHAGAGADARVGLDLHVAEAAAEPDHHARHAAVAHDQVGAEPDDGDRNLGRQVLEEIGEIGLVLRHEQHLRRPADAEPGQLGAAAGSPAAARAARACGLSGQQRCRESHRGRVGATSTVIRGERREPIHSQDALRSPHLARSAAQDGRRSRISRRSQTPGSRHAPERGELAGQRVGPLRDVAGAEADDDVAGLRQPLDDAREVVRRHRAR